MLAGGQALESVKERRRSSCALKLEASGSRRLSRLGRRVKLQALQMFEHGTVAPQEGVHRGRDTSLHNS